jgi:hypothetical protein
MLRCGKEQNQLRKAGGMEYYTTRIENQEIRDVGLACIILWNTRAGIGTSATHAAPSSQHLLLFENKVLLLQTPSL